MDELRNLPDDARLAEGNFDAVLNVESSHCYPDIDKFYAEVLRMLKPGAKGCQPSFSACMDAHTSTCYGRKLKH